jgi:hypothetical protein
MTPIRGRMCRRQDMATTTTRPMEATATATPTAIRLTAARSSSEAVGAVAIIMENIGAAIEVAIEAATPVTIGQAAIVPAAIDRLPKEAGIEPYGPVLVTPPKPGKDVVIGVTDAASSVRLQPIMNRLCQPAK